MKRRRRPGPVSTRRLVQLGQRMTMLEGMREAEDFNQEVRATCHAAVFVPEVECAGPVDPHEPLTRARGGSIIDRGNVMKVCRAHHDWIHHHPVAAHTLGLLVHSWDRR